MKRTNGFTLIEIMFVVAIIGLLAAIGVPSILNAMKGAQEKTRMAHLASIEKAKGLLTLPELVYAYGRGLDTGAVFGVGEYTEENLVSCIKNVDSLEELVVGGYYLIPGDIGTKAHYTKTRPAYASD
jgi:prepilin-type N-terminal cleavage/methylation domain-containing protein